MHKNAPAKSAMYSATLYMRYLREKFLLLSPMTVHIAVHTSRIVEMQRSAATAFTYTAEMTIYFLCSTF